MRLWLAAMMVLLLTGPLSASGQGTASVPPLPKPLTTAKTLFIGMGGAALQGQSQMAASLLYTSVLQAFATGPYALTQDPERADLVGVISIQSELSDVSFGSSSNAAFLHFTLSDPHTRAVLWVLNEDLQGSLRKTTFERNLDASTRKLAADVKTLAGGKLP